MRSTVRMVDQPSASPRYVVLASIVAESYSRLGGTAETAGQTGCVDEAFAYTGRWLDKATGLQNNFNRWYDCKTGRWLSEDLIGFAAGDANLAHLWQVN